jgi:hypothetical protein
MNTIAGNATRSPQVKRSSVPPCRPHTPCLGARSAGISFALRLQARISALMADRFAWLSPWLRPGGSTQALQIPSRDGHPALLASRDARPPGYARLLVYASPLRGCGGTFTRKRSALLGAQPELFTSSHGRTGGGALRWREACPQNRGVPGPIWARRELGTLEGATIPGRSKSSGEEAAVPRDDPVPEFDDPYERAMGQN